MKIISITILIFFFTNLLFAQQPEYGQASYYADKFNGRSTASGEKFDNSKYTAAHRTYPFGTMIKVTNINNNSFAIVRVNDRGPWVKGRIVDVSKVAAKDLSMIGPGVIDVKIEIYQQEQEKKDTQQIAKSAENGVVKNLFEVQLNPVTYQGFGIQVGSYQYVENLFAEILRIKKEYGAAPMVHVSVVNNLRVYRLILGPYDSREKAARKLKRYNDKEKAGFVIELDKLK
jgi:rare lipoprotein A